MVFKSVNSWQYYYFLEMKNIQFIVLTFLIFTSFKVRFINKVLDYIL